MLSAEGGQNRAYDELSTQGSNLPPKHPKKWKKKFKVANSNKTADRVECGPWQNLISVWTNEERSLKVPIGNRKPKIYSKAAAIKFALIRAEQL